MTEEVKDQSLSKPLKFSTKKTGLAAQREAAGLDKTDVIADYTKYTNRIGIVFDDSGSMQGQPISDAKVGVDEFVRVCNPRDTAVALYHFGKEQYPLTHDMALVSITAQGFDSDFSTPLFTKLGEMIDKENLSRAIVFSDGAPDNHEKQSQRDNPSIMEQTIQKFVEKKVPCDTVYIGSSEHDEGAKTLKQVAERTGGIFLHFKKGSNTFKTAFKYLAPAYRAMLTDGNFVKKLERGEV